MIRVGPTKKTHEKAEHNGKDNKAPVPHMIVSDKRDAEEHEDDAVACCTMTHQ